MNVNERGRDWEGMRLMIGSGFECFRVEKRWGDDCEWNEIEISLLYNKTSLWRLLWIFKSESISSLCWSKMREVKGEVNWIRDWVCPNSTTPPVMEWKIKTSFSTSNATKLVSLPTIPTSPWNIHLPIKLHSTLSFSTNSSLVTISSTLITRYKMVSNLLLTIIHSSMKSKVNK